MTERELRRDIGNAEKELRQLESQHCKLERLANTTAERLAKINTDGEPSKIMSARIERDTAAAMLADNERDQNAARERIDALTAQAGKASLAEQAANALGDLEGAKAEWRKAATAAVRTLRGVMEEMEAKSVQIHEAYSRASAAVAADTGKPETVNASVTWSGISGVSSVGMIETENMSMQPPYTKSELAQMLSHLSAPRRPTNGENAYNPDDLSGWAPPFEQPDLLPTGEPGARVALSLQTMGLIEKTEQPEATIEEWAGVKA